VQNVENPLSLLKTGLLTLVEECTNKNVKTADGAVGKQAVINSVLDVATKHRS
jgi:hypothetical protein